MKTHGQIIVSAIAVLEIAEDEARAAIAKILGTSSFGVRFGVLPGGKAQVEILGLPVSALTSAKRAAIAALGFDGIFP